MGQWRSLLLILLFAFAGTNTLLTKAWAKNKPLIRKLHIPGGVSTTNEIHVYVVDVLERALTLTENEYGPFQLADQREATVQSRQLLNLDKGIADIIWMVSNGNRDNRARAIAIPVIGGLYGYRVLMVRRADPRFAQPLLLEQLKTLTFTQAEDWPDTQILRNNQFSVRANPYRAGFRAVRNGYVDAYPRALHEAKLELKDRVTNKLALDKHHLLFYPNPLFFYVNKNNKALATRIEKGLNTMIEDGELQAMLESTDFYQRALTAFEGRTVYELKNSILSDVALRAIDRYLEDGRVLEYANKSGTDWKQSD